MAIKKRHYSGFSTQYYVSLTEICNWQCSYCDFPKLNKPKSAPIERVLEYFDMLKEATGHDQTIEYGLEGGEIGILSQDYLDQVFAHDLTETYTICTNGLFMERGYHERYKDKIHYILYHTQPEITNNCIIPDFIYDPSIKVEYALVITKTNLYDGTLEKVINDYIANDRYFIFHILQPRTLGLDLLGIDDFKKLYSILEGKPNVEPHFIIRVAKIIANLEKTSWVNSRRTICANSYQQPIFDIPNERINRCCISISGDTVPYTVENLKKLYNHEKLFLTSTDSVCDGCIAGFVWDDGRINDVSLKAHDIIHQFAIEENAKR